MNYQKRLKRVQSELGKHQIDGLVIFDLLNIRYLTGFDGSYGVLVIGTSESWFITDGRYAEVAGQIVKGAETIILPNKNRDGFFEDFYQERGFNQLGFEGTVPWSDYEYLKKRLAKTKTALVEKSKIVSSHRLVKDDDEIACIRKAAEIADHMMQTVWNEIKPGMTEREISRRIRYICEEAGGERESFSNIVATGANSSRPHHHPGDTVFQSGDMITIDLGAVYQGYSSDMTRNPNLGKPDPKYLEIYEICLEAQQAAVKACTAGVTGKHLDQIAREIISSKGYGDHFQHGLGHGVGLEIHESPRLSQSSTDTMQAGHIVTVEPGIYLPGFGGVRIEDLLVVTDGDPIILSQTPLTLHVIDS